MVVKLYGSYWKILQINIIILYNAIDYYNNIM